MTNDSSDYSLSQETGHAIKLDITGLDVQPLTLCERGGGGGGGGVGDRDRGGRPPPRGINT